MIAEEMVKTGKVSVVLIICATQAHQMIGISRARKGETQWAAARGAPDYE
jgi:hypothetical protein